MRIEGSTLIIPDDREFLDTDVLTRPVRNSNLNLCQTIKTVIIGKALARLQSADGNPEPFNGYTGLERITVSPENKAFRDIDGVLFSKDGTRLITFPDCHSTEYAVPDSVVHIERSAFDYANALESLTFGRCLRTIGLAAFFHCSELRILRIPEGVKSIGPGAFSYCSRLRELELPSGIEELVNSLFYECPALEAVVIPEVVAQRFRTIDGAIYNAEDKALVRVPPGYPHAAFAIAPDTESIGDYAFYGCAGIQEIQIPASVREIRVTSLAMTTELRRITVDGGNRFFCDVDGVLYSKNGTRLVAWPGGRFGACVIPDLVLELGDYCFFSVIYPKKNLKITWPAKHPVKKGFSIFNPKAELETEEKE